jgi:asparagine synthase (glutamine-hydrolysing)
MCGIAGEWNWAGGTVQQNVTANAIAAIKHRGPEGQTCWVGHDGALALGYAKLSFFRDAKPQPVTNETNSIFAVCNGEIYNHSELTQLMRQCGFNPAIRSDVEVIPYLYELRGVAGFALLRGEFAFALFDSRSKQLFLVRDRFGIKPLYYHAGQNSVIFASEAKAIFTDARVPRDLDKAALAARIFGVALPGKTSFSAISEVRPGCYVELSATGISERSYWSPTLKAARCSNLAPLADELREVLDEAVRVRLHGDFPIGAYLSGGIDSAAVTASMVHAGATHLKAYTINFKDRLVDETQVAADTAARLGIEHHILPVSDGDISESFLHSVWQSEIPVFNCHGAAKFLLSRAASADVKAVMTGEGSDELFAGYAYFSAAAEPAHSSQTSKLSYLSLLFRRQRAVPAFFAMPREKDVSRLMPIFGCTPFVGLRALYYARLLRPFLNRDFVRYFSPVAGLHKLREDFASFDFAAMTATNANRLLALRHDLPAYMLNYLADRQEMAHSVEGRVPFLDDEVVDFAARLGDKSLVGEAGGKALIRMAFANRLPPAVLTSPKRPFVAPPGAVDEVLRREWAGFLLSRSYLDAVGIFDWKSVTLARMAARLTPEHSGLGIALRTLLILIVSVQALHHLFVAKGSAS